MSWGRYWALKSIVGFALFLISVFPTFALMGVLGGLIGGAGAPVGFAIVGLAWLFTMTFSTHAITEKLVKRWSK